MASFYWSLTGPDIGVNDSSSQLGEALLQKLEQLLDKNISLVVATSSRSLAKNSTDLQVLAARGAQVRFVPMRKLTGGVLHSKFWVVDGRHIYLGSANMDWRALTQVKELGAIIYNCSRLALDLEKTFQTYWVLGAPKAVLPRAWPQNFSSHINRFQPLRDRFDGVPTTAYFSASPPMLCPHGRTRDLEALLAVMGSVGKGKRRKEPPGLWMGQVSKLVNKDTPGSCQEAGPDDPKIPGAIAKDPSQELFLMPPDPLASELAQNGPSGSAPGRSPAGEERQPPGSLEPPEEDRRPSGSEPDLESSSLASCLGSQILGEVNHFPWDVQSSPGSEQGVGGQSGPGAREQRSSPFLGLQLSHMQSSADEQSESEDYSEDQRFYQHILQMVKISRRLEVLGLPESMQETPCKGTAGVVCCMAAESSGMPSEGAHEAVRAMERDSRFLAWGREMLEHPQEVALAPAGQEVSQQACFQPSSSPLRQGLIELSSSRGLAAEPGKMQLLNQVGFLASMACGPP